MCPPTCARQEAPKYAHAEPVLLVRFQDMYSNIYKCLTQHWSTVHVEQVDWGMGEPLGVMLPDLHGKAVPAEYQRLPLDTEVLPSCMMSSGKTTRHR